MKKMAYQQGQYRITSIMLPTDELSEETLTEFRIMCARDAWSFSEGVWYAIKEYVKEHSKGNPQQRMDTIIETGKAYRAKPLKCFVSFCKHEAVEKVVNVKGATYNACADHAKNCLDSGKWRIQK